MTNKSNDYGRAYEYIFLILLQHEINKVRSVVIEENSSYKSAKRAWDDVNCKLQDSLKTSAYAAIDFLFDLEPLILQNDDHELILKLQSDSFGKSGDVRDIVIVKKDLIWEIGLSIKHQSFAVKHSRLGKSLDFCYSWFDNHCSEKYWKTVAPIFDYLQTEKDKQTKWSDIPNKEDVIYEPLLQAFMEEIMRNYNVDKTMPKRLVEYLLGKYDFYKIISLDNKKVTQIQTFNLRGKLNQPGVISKPKFIVPIGSLPTRIISIGFKPKSKTTIELFLDNGWQFTFRIHNASTFVETSLKFDIKIIGMPTTIMIINCPWK